MDDWRGEHLIRAVKRNPNEGNGFNLKTRPPVPAPNKCGRREGWRKMGTINIEKVCAVPGCDAFLNERNTAGVCRSHNHAEQCKCKQCEGARRSMVAGALTQKRRLTMKSRSHGRAGCEQARMHCEVVHDDP